MDSRGRIPASLLRLLILFLFVLATGVQAQTTSTISGTVHDKQGLAITGAVVQVPARN